MNYPAAFEAISVWNVEATIETLVSKAKGPCFATPQPTTSYPVGLIVEIARRSRGDFEDYEQALKGAEDDRGQISGWTNDNHQSS